MPARKKPIKLSLEQIETLGQFNDISYEYPKLNFDQAAEKVLGKNWFPNTAQGKAFRKEAKVMFDRERK